MGALLTAGAFGLLFALSGDQRALVSRNSLSNTINAALWVAFISVWYFSATNVKQAEATVAGITAQQEQQAAQQKCQQEELQARVRATEEKARIAAAEATEAATKAQRQATEAALHASKFFPGSGAPAERTRASTGASNPLADAVEAQHRADAAARAAINDATRAAKQPAAARPF